MNAKAKAIIDNLNAVYEKFKRPLTIIETGTIRYPDCDTDGNSTRYIAEWVRDNEPTTIFVSVDLHTEKASEYLKELGLMDYVSLFKFDSLRMLGIIKNTFEFVYLDSSNDPQHTLDEFMAVWPKLEEGGCLMADDCNVNSPDLLKGDLLIPYLTDKEMDFEILPTNQLVIWK